MLNPVLFSSFFLSLTANSVITTEFNGNICTWQTGEPLSSTETRLGETVSYQACHELVLTSEPNAVAATRHVNSGTCYANFGSVTSLVQMTTSQTCIFGTLTQEPLSMETTPPSECVRGEIYCESLQSCLSSRSNCPSPSLAPSIEQPPFCELSSFPSTFSSLDCGVITLPSTGSTCAVIPHSDYVCEDSATCVSYNTWSDVNCVHTSTLPISCASHEDCSGQYCYQSECVDYASEGSLCQPGVVLCDPELNCLLSTDSLTGMCSLPSACASDSDCTDQYCANGSCTDYLDEGAVCNSDNECGPLHACAWLDALTNVCQKDGTCRFINCGCPDNFLRPWCSSDNSLVGEWCSRSEINCESCGATWCSRTQDVCEYYKIDSDLSSSDVSSGAASILAMEGVFQKLTNTLYASGDRYLYLGDEVRWTLNHTAIGISTSTSPINEYVQSDVSWEFHTFDSPSDISTNVVQASCVSAPPSVLFREVEGSAAAQVIFAQMAYQAIKVEQLYASGEDGSLSSFATSPYPLLDASTRFGVLAAEDPSTTLANVIRYFVDASLKTECRDFFATLLSADGALNTDAMDALLSSTDSACVSLSLEDLQSMQSDPDNSNWGLCAGTSDYSARGFPSCLWMVWHGLTVNRNEIVESQGLMHIVNAFFAFYSKVYSPIYRSNFISVVSANFFDPAIHTDCSWLMQIHNEMTSIAAADESQNYFGVRDPYYPKIQWPSDEMCWNCLDDVTKAEEFLRVFYADDSVTESDLLSQLQSFQQQECVLGSTYSLAGDGLEPCGECTPCLSTTLSECSTNSDSECKICETNDDCVSEDHYCSSEGCVAFLHEGQRCIDPFFGLLDVQCGTGLLCDSARTGTCRTPCTDGFDYSSDGFEPCNRCSLCLGPVAAECTQTVDTLCQQWTPPPSECDLSSSGLSIGSTYPILDVTSSQFADSVLSLVIEVPMNFDSSKTRISFIDATYDDLTFEGIENDYWTLREDIDSCRTYYSVTVDWAYFWTMDWGGLEFVYVTSEDQYAYTGEMFFQTSQINDDGIEQTAEWTIPFVFVQPTEVYVETDSTSGTGDSEFTFRSMDDRGNPIIVGLVGVDTQISWVSMASVLSDEGNVQIDIRFYTTVPSPKKILDTGFRVSSADSTIKNTELNRILDCDCQDTASSCAVMINYCHIFSAVCKSTCNACDSQNCRQFWQLLITLDDVCDIKGKYVLGLQQYDASTGDTTEVDSGVTLSTSSACMSIGDGSTMQSMTNVFGEPHTQALRLGFNVGDTVYFETKVVSVLAQGQKQTTTLKEVHVYQEATRLTDVIYRDGKVLSWGANAGFSVDDISDDSVWFSFRLDPESCVTLVDDTRVVVTAIVEVTFENDGSRRLLAFVTDSNRIQSENSLTIFGSGGSSISNANAANSDWPYYAVMGIFLTLSVCVVVFLVYRRRQMSKDVVAFSSVNAKIAT